MNCRNCQNFLMPGKMMCLKCGDWSPNGIENIGGASANEVVKEDDFIDAYDVEASTLERIVTGTLCDECWGGGFVPSSITLIGGPPGGGKRLCLSTPLPTPTGWTTMGDVRPGDTLFDETGAPCTVLQITEPVLSPASYEVVFSDGEVIKADAEHLWHTTTKAERGAALRRGPEARALRRAKRPSRGRGLRQRSSEYNPKLARAVPTLNTSGEIRSTQQIIETLHAGEHTNHAIERTRPLNLPSAELPIPPYTLGVWLGDGTVGDGNYTANDLEIATRVRADGYEVRHHPHQDRADTNTVIGLKVQLRAADILHAKHIPQIYLRASIEQRIELLRGLMDTDGDCATDGKCNFNTTIVALRDTFAELLNGLGIKASYGEHDAILDGEYYGPSWRFTFVTAIKAFHLPRKRRRQRAPVRGVDAKRYIVDVRNITPTWMRCIAVDSPSHLYLAGRGMVPTHNTSLLIYLAKSFSAQTKKPTYLISAEQDKGEIKIALNRFWPDLQPGMMRVLKKMGAGGTLDEAALNKAPPGMLILDSISALCGNDKHAQIQVGKRYKQYAVKYKAPTFIIAHMTKESDFAGLMTLQHDVDVLVTVFPEEDGSRTIKAWKNRFGPTHKEYRLILTEHGYEAPPEEEKKGKRRGPPPPVQLIPRDAPLRVEGESEPIPGKIADVVPINKFKRPASETAPAEIAGPDGQRLVRRPKKSDTKLLKEPLTATVKEVTGAKGVGAKGIKPKTKAAQAAAVEGEALKRRRPPMPKTRDAKVKAERSERKIAKKAKVKAKSEESRV